MVKLNNTQKFMAEIVPVAITVCPIRAICGLARPVALVDFQFVLTTHPLNRFCLTRYKAWPETGGR